MVNRPVTPGETHVLAIEELGSEGDGVGYVDDFAVLVDGASLGETVQVEITDVGDNYARGDMVDAEFGFD
ncbi:TRAM domain-containing protein [Haloplanus aerogenes]|uniref:23S rRNA (Uracil1939-C5)-methyltransferase n=1 Tax=Haloplanus aerogenes TaxID=660522 RepID=A0A3M0DZY4_9EURY|nr:TRAM domain-containing protein [Haloplanus aerogenes]AZH25431.1 TRAM domain-containing protein [Haloplanus aerogenes]RMB25143.1 23S rRNA (uracil1939-C5)-methyltransferase [Haloplanus aerogenes]